MIDLITLAIAKKYTLDTAIGLGAVRGSPCTIYKTETVQGGTKVTFRWTGTDGTIQTKDIVVKDGISVIGGEIINKHLVIILSDGNRIDCGEFPINDNAEQINYENEDFPTLTNVKLALDNALSSGAKLEQSLAVSNPLGSATSGKIYAKNTSLETIIRDILIKEIAPNLTLSLVPNRTLYDVVDEVISAITIKSTCSKNTYPLSKVEFYLNNTLKNTQVISTNGTYTYDMIWDIPTNSNFTIKSIVYDNKTGTPMSTSKSITVKFVGKSYYGTINADIGEPTEAIIKSLQNNVLKDTKNLTYSGITMEYGKVVYAYPASFNALTYIKDEKNNFSYFESFTKTSLTIDSIPYFCYTLNEPVQCDSTELVFK